MSTRTTLTSLAVAVLAALAFAALAVLAIAPSAAFSKGRDGFHATVLKVAPGGDAVRVRRSGGAKLRVEITPSTRFERIAGVAALRRGMAIEIKATRTGDRWVAREIEISGGDDDRGGAEPGDDHGSGGHGADDR